MKCKSKVILAIICLVSLLLPFCANGADIPQLKSISFTGATIEGQFKSDVYEYELVLDNSGVSPQLSDYLLDGDGNLFVTYQYDDTNHQTAVVVTVEYSSGSAIYTFNYKNPVEYVKNSENHLESITCTMGEISPEINDNDTSYKLYIPKDLTELHITPVTRDTNAYCAPVDMTLAKDQEPVITLSVTASDGSVRIYELKVKRVNKTVAEVQADPGASLVAGTRFYQQEPFIITAVAVGGGIVVIILLFWLTRRITMNVYDSEEPDFYSRR